MITTSKVKIFRASRRLYRELYVDRTKKRELTSSMKIGSACDDLVFLGRTAMEAKVLKKDDPDGYEKQQQIDDDLLVSADQFAEAVLRAEAVTREPFYKWWRDNGAEFQKPLRMTVKWNGRMIEAAGMPDAVTKAGRTIYIDDLKCTSAGKVKSDASWWYNCADMGYFDQLGVYKHLVMAQAPKKRPKIVCRHAVVYPAGDGVFRAKLFILSDAEIERGWKRFLATAAEIVDAGGVFEDPPACWEEAVLLTRLKEQN